MNILPGRDTRDTANTAPKFNITKPAAPKPVGVTAAPAVGGGSSGATFSNPNSGGSSTYLPPQTGANGAPAPTAPNTTQGDATKQGSDTTRAMLEATLAAIEAETGLTMEQLITDESDIGRQYRFLLAQARREGVRAQEAVQAGALDRGILQSGIYAEDTARLQQQVAEQTSSLEADRAAQLGALRTEQALLPAQASAAQAAAAQQAAAAGLDLDVIKALAGGGLG